MPKHFLPIVTALLVAGVVHAQDAASRYVQAPAGSSLVFGFDQAGAASEGSFQRFSTTFTYDEKNLAASSLSVTVQTASLDTQDADRDMTLKGADLLATEKFPTATYTARSLEKSARGVQAVGQLTLRGVTKDLRIPLAIRQTAAGLELSGSTTIKRLDYGVGQGEWKATDSVGDEIKVTYKVALVKAQ
jgi:polyisoprenoid-binding protein YceI